MCKVKIFTDSTCDLSKQLLEDSDITMVPLYVTFNEASYKDTVEMNTADLYCKVDELGILPKTAAPTPLDFIEAFRPYINAGDDIVYIGLSSKLSSTIQNALIAAKEFPEGRIHIVDSLNLSTGIGILVMKAHDLAAGRLTAAEVAESIRHMVSKVRTAFTIDTFDYLYKGGRCSAMQGIVGSMLKIKPITRLIDGNILLYDKQRGRKKALFALLQEIEKDREIVDESRVFVTHSFADEAALYLQQELSEKLKLKNIYTTNAGCVISSHCGKETIGIIYMVK